MNKTKYFVLLLMFIPIFSQHLQANDPTYTVYSDKIIDFSYNNSLELDANENSKIYNLTKEPNLLRITVYPLVPTNKETLITVAEMSLTPANS